MLEGDLYNFQFNSVKSVLIIPKIILLEITIFYLISSWGNFVEENSFRIVSGKPPEIKQKLSLSTKF